jgi:hypothetical protein
MKAIPVLAVSIILVSAWFCPITTAAPPMPSDVQMVEPDPSLPKELADFCGKWEGGSAGTVSYFLIVEKIDQEKANCYVWGSDTGNWRRFEAKVAKERGKYKLWHRMRRPRTEDTVIIDYTLKGEYLEVATPIGPVRYTRVP